MQYSKGDTIKFTNGSVGLVLDSGLSGSEFYHRLTGREFNEIFSDARSHPRIFYCQETNVGGLRRVWYPVLLGDVKGWHAVR